jgi:O-succinylbenzoic acid--CoA ligase
VYTSGTTGVPKGVRLSRRAFIESATSTALAVQLQNHDRWLLCMPLAHVGGLSIITRCLLSRCALVLQSPAPSKGFDPVSTWRLMDETGVTVVSVVPTQLQRLLEISPRAPAALRLVLLGGASAPPGLLARAAAAGWVVLCTYGLTEACSAVTIQREPGTQWTANAAGSALPGVEIQIEGGRILVRSKALLSGYFPDSGPPLNDAGWFVAADCGEIIEGELYVLGRSDDAIITGGENVHPLEVERALLEHPAIEDVCVFGLEDPEWGQVVAAAIVSSDHAALSDLRAWLVERLASFKLPRKVALVDALPLTPTGKVNRLRCRQLFGPQCRDLQ